MSGDRLPVLAGVHYANPGVDQTTFADSLNGGNCLQACVATILSEPLDMVPNFYLFGPTWVQAIDLFLANWGLTIEKGTDTLGVTIAIGTSERGIKHAVLYANGEMVHDPHPSRTGLTTIDYHLGVWGSVFQDMHDHAEPQP